MYTPTTKKLMVMSSSGSESDSDTENIEKDFSKVEKVINSGTPKFDR